MGKTLKAVAIIALSLIMGFSSAAPSYSITNQPNSITSITKITTFEDFSTAALRALELKQKGEKVALTAALQTIQDVTIPMLQKAIQNEKNPFKRANLKLALVRAKAEATILIKNINNYNLNLKNITTEINKRTSFLSNYKK